MNGWLTRAQGAVVRHGAGVVVYAGLGALAWWGHHTGWKAPKASEVFARAKTIEEEDWCEAHGIPDSKCLACHPELGGDDPEDWCKEHGVPESRCTVCHPEILTRGRAADWCREHGVPESQCTLCRPEVAVRGAAPPADGAAVSLDPGAAPAKDPLACQTHAIRVQFASAEAIRKAGVQLEAVQERPMAARVSAAAEVAYDPTRVARLSTRAAGTVWRVERNVGQPVKRGEVLALVDSLEVGRSRSELLQALAAVELKMGLVERLRALVGQHERHVTVRTEAHERLRVSTGEGYRTRSDLKEAEAALAGARIQLAEKQASLQEAEAAVREARIRLLSAQQALLNLGLPIRLEEAAGLSESELAGWIRLLGLPDGVKKTLDAGAATANLIPVVAPFDGVVLAREIVAGEVVDPSRTLFVVADVSRMWVTLDIRQEDAASVAVGQTILFRPDGTRDGSVRGRLSWISTAADEKTRTVRARAEVENADGHLRAHSFGTGRIVVRESPTAVAVPTVAIQWEGCCHVVFVRLTDEVFQTRKVRLGARSGAFTEIVVGVMPGEVVATTGSHVLKSELLKSKLGAGCAED